MSISSTNLLTNNPSKKESTPLLPDQKDQVVIDIPSNIDSNTNSTIQKTNDVAFRNLMLMGAGICSCFSLIPGGVFNYSCIASDMDDAASCVIGATIEVVIGITMLVCGCLYLGLYIDDCNNRNR